MTAVPPSGPVVATLVATAVSAPAPAPATAAFGAVAALLI